jgi:hypothetical protein
MNSNFNPLTPSAVNFGKNQVIDPFVQNKSWTVSFVATQQPREKIFEHLFSENLPL